mmetsp:Transcript_21948/g.48535  ORF Transcript_21948/g.48535 Transcript_21948/m.48535 type:complete len:235 (-) Transcript_21948:1202-1906(-)
MTFEELISTIIVPVTVCTDCEEVLDDCGCGLEASAGDGPLEGRDALRADLYSEHPGCSFAAGSACRSPGHLTPIVGVDGLHDDGGALHDGPDQTLRNQAEGPTESLYRQCVRCDALRHLDAGGHERAEKLRGDSVAYVTKPKSRDVVYHLHWVAVKFEGHVNDFRGDEVQVGVGLLEVVLPCRCRHEEFGVDLLSHLEGLGLIQRTKELRQGCLPRRRITHGFVQKPFDILPQP